MTAETIDITEPIRHFGAGYRLGYATGYDVGHHHGQRDADEHWTSALTGCTTVFRQPRQRELGAIRNEVITTPCPVKCRRCSRCIRYETWYRQGQRDYPGQPTETSTT